MPRKASDKPWLHAKSGFWCATINGTRTYLDRDYRTACQKLKALRSEAKRLAASGRRDWLDAPFAELGDEYLSDIKARKKPGTYRNFRYCLLRALKIIGTKVRVGEMRKFHLAQIERELTGQDYSPTTIKDTLATVQGVLHWAIRNDLVDMVNPLIGYEKPRARQRSRVFTPAEFQALLRNSDAAFRRVLLALRMTGCRPGELRSLIWEWVDLDQGVWIFPDHKTITRQRNPMPKIVPLSDPILKLCRWLARTAHEPSDFVFLNMMGKPYTKDCVVKKMGRIRTRAKIPVLAGEQVVLYTNRHSFGTEGAGKVTDLELAELMGQTDLRTTRRYLHLNKTRLHDIRRRLQS